MKGVSAALLRGIPIVGQPANGQVLLYDAAGRVLTWGAGGGGANAFAVLAGSFVQPVQPSLEDPDVHVVVMVDSTAAYSAGMYAEVSGNFYLVSAVASSIELWLQNLGYPENAAAGTTIGAAGVKITPCGARGADGPPGAPGADGLDGATGPAGPAPPGTGLVYVDDAPKQASGEWHRMIYRASGISTRCVITACYQIHFAPHVSGAYPSAGVFAMNSSDGKFVCCGTAQSGSTGFGYAHLDRYSWNGSSVSYVSSVSVQADFAGLNSTVALISSYHWVRLDIDPASTRKYYRSADGANWVLVASTAYNDHITAWDRVGFYCNPQTAGIAASLVSWQVGTTP